MTQESPTLSEKELEVLRVKLMLMGTYIIQVGAKPPNWVIVGENRIFFRFENHRQFGNHRQFYYTEQEAMEGAWHLHMRGAEFSNLEGINVKDN